MPEGFRYGRMGYVVSEETRKKLSAAGRGRKMSEDAKKKISEKAIERYRKRSEQPGDDKRSADTQPQMTL